MKHLLERNEIMKPLEGIKVIDIGHFVAGSLTYVGYDTRGHGCQCLGAAPCEKKETALEEPDLIHGSYTLQRQI
ncbi:MAG: hypothetical protein DDT33_00693 [Firmicutes bacterium]|nr:hypothetical protein [Bacillota bacterium]